MIKEHDFEGVVPSLARRYKETDSIVVREELAKYLNSKPCPACAGTRLRTEARNVKIADLAIYEVSAMPLKRGLAFFQGLKLAGHRAAIADRILGLWFSQEEILALVTIQQLLEQLEPGLLGAKLKPLQLSFLRIQCR